MENITRMNQLGKTTLRVALAALGLLPVNGAAGGIADGRGMALARGSIV